MKAIILAAGAGSRNFPYELTRQKAALPVGDTYLARWTVECLNRAGIGEIFIVVGHLHERVRHALLGLNVRFVHQQGATGTAGAVLDALAVAGDDEPFLVIYGDCLFDEEGLCGFIRAFADQKPFAAAALSPLGERDSLNWLCGSVSWGGELSGISGHPRGASHRLCGLYGLSPDCVPFVRANPGFVDSVNVGGMPAHEAELAQSLQLAIDAGNSVMAWEHTGLFVDIDKPWHVLEANHALAQYLCGRLTESRIAPDARIHDGAEIGGHVCLGPGAVIGNRVVIQGNLIAGAGTQITNGAILGGNCVLGSKVRCKDYCQVGGGACVGSESLIGHGAELGGVLFEGVYLYHYCEMAGVFGARHDVGAATVCGTLRFDDGDTTHLVNGRRETPEVGANVAYFGDYTRTGVNAIIMPGVKVGAYSCVGPGVVQSEDLPHNTVVLVEQQTVRKEWGPNRYGW